MVPNGLPGAQGAAESSISNPMASTSVSGTNGPHNPRKYPARERLPTAAMSSPVAGGFASSATGIAARIQTAGYGGRGRG